MSTDTDKKPQERTFRVYVSQVNEAMVEVKARTRDEARERGYAQWRRDYAHSYVCAVEEQEQA